MIRGYVLDLVRATREHEDVALGASPRASIALYRTGQALAAIRGRDFVLPDDVKKMAPAILAHRLILKPEARLRKQNADAVVKEIVMDTRTPIMQTADTRDEFQN
jgi:MoxR-like ATPase